LRMESDAGFLQGRLRVPRMVAMHWQPCANAGRCSTANSANLLADPDSWCT